MKRTEETTTINAALAIHSENRNYLDRLLGRAEPGSDSSYQAAAVACAVAERTVRDLKLIDEQCQRLGIVPELDIDALRSQHRTYADKFRKVLGTQRSQG